MINCIYDGCNKKFSCQAKLEDHMNVHLNIRPHECAICGSSYTSKKGLNAHKLTHEPPKHCCETCGFKFAHKHSLKAHLQTCNRVFTCEHCGKNYEKRKCYEDHIYKKHTLRGPRVGCDKCDKTFLHKADLRKHIKIVHEEQRIYCPHCNKAYSYQKGLKLHLEKYHNDLNILDQ